MILSAGLIFFLNEKISTENFGDLPPLGRLLDPFHGFWQNAHAHALDIRSDLNFPGLKENTVIQYEDNLIPHIFSENEHDLYFAQGYITASHRLWQMEFMTYVAAGRISEILGEQAVQFDRRQRRKGLMYGAENSLKALEENKDQLELLNAYADGVNSYIDRLDFADLPIEYKLMDYSPEKWQPIKSLLLLKYMADDLSGSDSDLENTNAVQLLGRDRFNFLFPDLPDDIEPIIPRDHEWDFEPLEVTRPDEIKIPETINSARSSVDNGGKGSNNWAVHGSKTNSGRPILCNDPHLGFSMPSIWFAQQLKAPDVNVYGVTIPGIPGAVLGFNDSLAWGLTNAPRDVRDWYHITFKDKERADYLYDGKWLKTQKRIETIEVRDAEPVIDTVIYTHYGPVVYDRSFKEDTTLVNYSLRWTAHLPSREILALYQINRAKNLDDMKSALFYLESPPQNVAVATRMGDVGLFVAGKFPLKWDEQGKFLMDGSDPAYEWQGFIPDEQEAFVFNPERGFVSSANQHPFTADYPYYYYNNTAQHFRNRRINNKLNTLTNITTEEMMNLQTDNYHMIAAQALPVMLDSLDETRLTTRQQEFAGTLRSWDFMASPELTAPSFFEAWWEKLETLLWDEFQREDMALDMPDEYITVKILNRFPEDSVFDIVDTPEKETYNDIILQSFIAANDSIDAWIEENNNEEPLWYKFRNTQIMHLARLKPFSFLEVPIGGNKHIVNANWATGGVSWRMIVELKDDIEAYGIYPGGQSGNPGNPAYDSFIDQWANGQYLKINFWNDPAERENTILVNFNAADNN